MMSAFWDQCANLASSQRRRLCFDRGMPWARGCREKSAAGHDGDAVSPPPKMGKLAEPRALIALYDPPCAERGIASPAALLDLCLLELETRPTPAEKRQPITSSAPCPPETFCFPRRGRSLAATHKSGAHPRSAYRLRSQPNVFSALRSLRSSRANQTSGPDP